MWTGICKLVARPEKQGENLTTLEKPLPGILETGGRSGGGGGELRPRQGGQSWVPRRGWAGCILLCPLGPVATGAAAALGGGHSCPVGVGRQLGASHAESGRLFFLRSHWCFMKRLRARCQFR